MAAFVFKVLTLTIKTISKPLAGRVQQFVLNHPRLRQPVINLAQALTTSHGCPAPCHASGSERACMPTLSQRRGTAVQVLHRMQVAVDRGAEGKVGKVFVANISEEKAMELAGRVVSEGFVWTVR